jgi:3-isopropylmalate/(R)-2-methylmalate dehydratase small subunit
MDSAKRAVTSGRAVTVRGNDIDTDRVIPARFLTRVVFDGLGPLVFADDRAAAARGGRVHPMDAPGAQGASILFVNKNFGCGSSREHAPQALARWGIRAIVGESFAEIFFGNCVAMGVPCVTAGEASMLRLMEANEREPQTGFTVDLEQMAISFAGTSLPVSLLAATREQFLTGRWDSTSELLEAEAQIRSLAATLPYWNGWA